MAVSLKIVKKVYESRPIWGAWIEMQTEARPEAREEVAPHTGRVD